MNSTERRLIIVTDIIEIAGRGALPKYLWLPFSSTVYNHFIGTGSITPAVKYVPRSRRCLVLIASWAISVLLVFLN